MEGEASPSMPPELVLVPLEANSPKKGRPQTATSNLFPPELTPFRQRRASQSRSTRSKLFQRFFFPFATDAEWNDWRWQLQNRFQDGRSLSRILRLSDDERNALDRPEGQLPVNVTPYYASLLDAGDSEQPLRRGVIPSCDEFVCTNGESDDPLAEDSMSPVHGLVHRYPDRVLFLITDHCAACCRYCTRSRVVGTGEMAPDARRWELALEYIENTPTIRDVLLSGGDPLTLSDDRLEYLLHRLRRIPHVEFVRIGTKVPVVLPQRITLPLVRMLRRYHPLWMSIHFMHPDEVTPEVERACERLADAGIPLGSQTVLLKGINDNVDTMKRLMHGLLRIRVRPYYLYQCDPITGSSQFRTPVEKGLEIIAGLRGFTTGYGVPHFVIDAPGGGGKIALVPNAVIGREEDSVLLRNYEGNVYKYPDASR